MERRYDMRDQRTLSRLGVLATLGCLVLSAPVAAEKWYFEPVASARLGYDDNVRLTPDNEESAASGLVNLTVPFGVRTEVSDIKMNAMLESRRFDGLSDADADDYGLNFDATRRYELHRLRLRGAAIRDNTRVSELDDTGLVQTSTERTKYNLNPSWVWQFSERTTVDLGYDYTDVSYDDGLRFDLVDYDYQAASVDLVHQLSERTRLLGSLMVSNFEADDVDTDQDSYWARVGVERDFDETLKGRLLVGVVHTESDYRDQFNNPTSDDDNSFLLDASLAKDFDTFTLKGALIASEVPTGRGRMLRKDALEITLVRPLSERTTFSMNGQWFYNESAGGIDFDDDERRFYSLTPKLSWKATRWWTVEGSYRYRNQEYTERGDGEAESNTFFLTVRYVWPREN